MQLKNEYESIYNCIEWVSKIDMSTSIIGANATVALVRNKKGMLIKAPEGDVLVSFDDYIIKDENDEFHLCEQNVFEQTYELIEGDEEK